jgi:hypothetical protein
MYALFKSLTPGTSGRYKPSVQIRLSRFGEFDVSFFPRFFVYLFHPAGVSAEQFQDFVFGRESVLHHFQKLLLRNDQFGGLRFLWHGWLVGKKTRSSLLYLVLAGSA